MGCGWDGIGGFNICGISYVNLENIYISKIKAHFNCGHDISTDGKLQLAIQAIKGLDVSSLSEEDKEVAAKPSNAAISIVTAIPSIPKFWYALRRIVKSSSFSTTA